MQPIPSGNHAVVYFGEPIYSGYVLIPRAHLANVTSLEHERRKRAQPSLPADGDQVARAR